MPSEERETPPPAADPPESSATPLVIQLREPPQQIPFGQATLPGSCVLRLENLESQTSQTKKELMHTIAQDTCATFICIARHAEAGNLGDQHTDVLDNVIKIIRDTDVRLRRRLERRVRRIRRERDWLRMKHRKMSREVEELSSLYRKKVRDLTAALQERNREVEQLRAQRELLRAKKIHDVLAGVDKSADANTDIDAEFEIDTEKV